MVEAVTDVMIKSEPRSSTTRCASTRRTWARLANRDVLARPTTPRSSGTVAEVAMSSPCPPC
ncbi:hypothetical protein QJS66_03815 [Kocuria rhizophila]|nr:hypothetical protein QJS66_03815 [Kocuria rhizophila]